MAAPSRRINMRALTRVCEFCDFYAPKCSLLGKPLGYGDCRRKAPSRGGRYPEVSPEHWCGQWQPADLLDRAEGGQ